MTRTRKYYIEHSTENNETLIDRAERSGNFTWADDFTQLMRLACPFSQPYDEHHTLKVMVIDSDNRFIVICNSRRIRHAYRLYDWIMADGNPLPMIDVLFSPEASDCSMNLKVDESLYQEETPTKKEKPKAPRADRTKIDFSGLKNTKASTKKASNKADLTALPEQLDIFA